MKMKYLLSVILIISIFVIPCFASTNLITQQDTTHPSQNIQVERWTIFQLKLVGPQTGNPFVDVSLTAEIKNGYNVYSPLGFYDGSGVYKIRFMPTETGEWSYITKIMDRFVFETNITSPMKMERPIFKLARLVTPGPIRVI